MVPTTNFKSTNLVLLGDLHGEFHFLLQLVQGLETAPPTALIQVGDFGLFPSKLELLNNIKPKFPVYVIRGNHDSWAIVKDYTDVTEIAENIFFVPDGTVLTLDGVRIGFCGGADSVDRNLRLQYRFHWEAEEVVSEAAVNKLILENAANAIDLLVTHAPPQSVIEANFSRDDLFRFGLPYNWTSPSAKLVGKLWSALGNPPLVCGHMHRNVTYGEVTILDSNTYIYLKDL